MNNSDKHVLLNLLRNETGYINRVSLKDSGGIVIAYESITWTAPSGGNIVIADIIFEMTADGSFVSYDLLCFGAVAEATNIFYKTNATKNYLNGDVVKISGIALTING
jgi:hypothetical protein